MDQPRADIIKNVLYSDSLYFLHSREKIYAHPLENSYIANNRINTSFLFLLRKDLYIAH